MTDKTFAEMLSMAKQDTDYLLKLVRKYEALISKYSVINGVFYEDLHSQLVEVTIKAIKNFKV